MIAAIVLVIGLLFLGVQMTEPASNVTLASELDLAPDAALTGWAVLDRPLHLILYDVPLSGLLLFAAGAIYWIADWLNEKLGLTREPPPPPTAPAPAPAPPAPDESNSQTQQPT